MSRLLYLAGDSRLSKRTLKLYIQVVGKAYEASKEGVGEDKDTDEYWVDTLVFGARMLCKTAAALPGVEGIDDVREAGIVLEKAKLRLNPDDKVLLAKLLLAEGVYWSLLALKGLFPLLYSSLSFYTDTSTGQDPLQRTFQLEKAHVVLQRSIIANATPSAYHHLALSFSRKGGPGQDLSRAIECAGHAVAGEPKEVRYWHLLGILLTAEEKWTEAKEILEHGAELGVDDEEGADAEDDDENFRDEGTPTPDGAGTVTQSDVQTLNIPGANGTVQVTDFASGKPKKINGVSNGVAKGSPLRPKAKTSVSPTSPRPATASSTTSSSLSSVLALDATEVPLASSLLKSTELSFESYTPSKAELFEWHLQLRMTQVALVEVVEGAEGAELTWLEIFGWVADRKNNVGDGAFPFHNSILLYLMAPRE